MSIRNFFRLHPCEENCHERAASIHALINKGGPEMAKTLRTRLVEESMRMFTRAMGHAQTWNFPEACFSQLW